jgi:P-type E1-E2 ATPase
VPQLSFVRRSFTTDRLQIIGVPVGLPCVTTTTMAVGAAFLARRKAIVQKLTAIESLAGVDVLCTDKTGTLTANQLSVHERTCYSHLEIRKVDNG